MSYQDNLATVDFGYTDPFERASLEQPDFSQFQLEQQQPNLLYQLIDRAEKLKLRKQVEQDALKQNEHSYSDDEDVTLPELLKEEGVRFQLTSGYREGARTKQGHKSNHSIPNGAYDIKPAQGESFEDLRKQIYTNKRIRDWMNDHGWGILEETTPAVMKKTGATGKHWHFGPDSAAVQNWKSNLVRYGQNGFKFENSIAISDDPPQLETQTPEADLMKKFIDEEMETPDTDQLDWSFDDTDKQTDIPFPVIKKKKEEKKKDNSDDTLDSLGQEIKDIVGDTQKASILERIAHNESGGNVNSKNPTSSASGLFGFTNQNKTKYGYGTTKESQIQAASRLYDDNMA